MARDLQILPARDQGGGTCTLVILLTVAALLARSIPAYLQQDVAWLGWTADRVLKGDVYGRDLYEVNPPLCMLIYMPAALLGRFVGLDLALKSWTAAITALSLACLWQTVERPLRLPVTATLGVFLVIAFPRDFGQREQLALLLCAPYAAGPARSRALGSLVGVMAGIGFALKPFFLLPLVLIFLTRRKVRTEEVAIAATGLAYAAVVLLFFQPWLAEARRMGPLYYGYVNMTTSVLVPMALVVPAMIAIVFLLAGRLQGASGFAMAATGFSITAILQLKGFTYHYLPGYGFLALYLAVALCSSRKVVRAMAMMLLGVEAWLLAYFTIAWVIDADGRRVIVPAMLAEVNRSRSYIILSSVNFPGYTFGILSDTPFVGRAPVSPYLYRAFVAEQTGDPNATTLRKLALDQINEELSRQPDLVIVGHDAHFDSIAWLSRDPRFKALWQNYAPSGRVDYFQFFRRK